MNSLQFRNSRFQLRVRSLHCLAPRAEDTDWSRILALYDQLPLTPVVRVNRAVALGMACGAQAGLAELDASELQSYAPFTRPGLIFCAGPASTSKRAQPTSTR